MGIGLNQAVDPMINDAGIMIHMRVADEYIAHAKENIPLA